MTIHKLSILFLCIAASTACNRKKFLEADPFSNSSTISSLTDCRSLLNNPFLFIETPVLGEITSDDYYLTKTKWSSLSKQDQNAYSWQPDIFQGQEKIPDYTLPYSQVNIANEILAALPLIKEDEKDKNEKADIEGTACFIRAYAFYNLLQIFARPFDADKAISDTGIALPIKPDASLKFYRATMQESYNRVIADLLQARKLLNHIVQYNRPSKPAADALLARVYLCMRDYKQAGRYADSCLQYYNKLMDYNLQSLSDPFRQNEEILYYSNLISSNQIILAKAATGTIVQPALYNSYSSNDLRKDLFFRLNSDNQPYSKSSYTGKIFPFSGLATDEMYLIRAEAKARDNNVQGALDDLNTLLIKRYKTGTFIPATAATWLEALKLILTERRKELVFRGLRFTDLRRLNKEGADIWISRETNNQYYQLPPDDLRYTLPIPEDAIANSDIVQNPRQ